MYRTQGVVMTSQQVETTIRVIMNIKLKLSRMNRNKPKKAPPDKHCQL